MRSREPLAEQFAGTGVRFIVNDRPDIAAMIGAGGVHVGQEDLPVEAARAICGSGCWVGVSTHNLAQLREADRTSADYIAVGPIFPTATKENPDPVVGIDFLRLARQETRKPLVAIGGITIESAAEVFRAGADSVAVIRDLLEAPSPSGRAREYLAIAGGAFAASLKPNMAEQAQTLAGVTGERTDLVKALGLFDAVMIVVGSMIGSAIFIVSGDISHQVQSPGLLLLVWIVAGVMTIICALSYGELAAMMPHAGGQYVFLRDSLGPIWGFLYGWTMLLVIQTATIAAVAIAFAKFTAVLVPFFSASDWIWKLGTFGPWQLWFGSLGPYSVGLNRQNLLAIASIVLLTWVNTRGLRVGKIVQNVFTVAKTGALAGLVLLGLFFSTAAARTANFTNFWRNASLGIVHPYPPDQPYMVHRHDYAGGRGDGGIALRRGRVEQRYVHGRRR